MPNSPKRVRVFINNVDRSTSTQAYVEMTYTLGARGICRVETLDLRQDSATAYRPVLDQPLVVKDEPETLSLFNGKIMGVADRALLDPNRGVVTAIEAADYSRACDARVITGSAGVFAAGQTLKQVVTSLHGSYLTGFGITLDAGMASGPTMGALTFNKVTVTDAFNRLTTLTGWPWRIGPGKMLEVFSPGSKPAFFSLTSSNSKILGGVKWARTRKQYVNRVILSYGSERQVEKSDSFAGDATTTAFPLTYPLLFHRGYVSVVIGGSGSDELIGTHAGGQPWEVNAGTQQIVRSSALGVGNTAQVYYTVQFPQTVTVEDASAATEPWEAVLEAPDVFTKAAATDLATGLLRKYLAAPRTITIRTREGFVLPGNTFTITIPERTISGAWLILSTTVRTDVDRKLTYDYTCVEGTEAVDSWIEAMRGLFGGGGSAAAGGTIAGTILPNSTGSFSTAVTALAGLNTTGARQSKLDNWQNASIDGPALILGVLHAGHSWAMTADHLAASPFIRRLRWTPLSESVANRYAMQLSQADSPTSGEYYLTGNSTISKLHLGGPSALFGAGFRIANIWTAALDVTDGVFERLRTVRMGEWIAVTFAAGNFTASGAMTWTVASADQKVFGYTLVGKTMTVSFEIETSTVGGTPGAALYITIPGGFTAAKTMSNPCWITDNNVHGIGVARVESTDNTRIKIFRQDVTNWSASTDLTNVRGEISFEVN